MTRDIVPALLEKIERVFKVRAAESKVIREKILALEKGGVTHKDSHAFAIELGRILAEALEGEIRVEDLPDDRMYYNIAKRVIEPNLQRNYELVGDYARDVQGLLNRKAGISIRAIKPPINQDRIDGIVNKLATYEDFSKGKWLLREPVVNFTQAIVDDTVKANADFQYRAGLRPKIIRKEAGNCCDWCKAVVGVYDYPNVPQDVYRRHRYCRCTVDYLPGDGKKQDIWSKKWTDVGRDAKIQERKEIKQTRDATLNLQTLKKLEEKNWTPAFKARAIRFYRETSQAGVEFSDHAIARVVHRVIGQKLMSQSDITRLLKGKPQFIQNDGRLVYNKDNVYFIKNPDTEDIVSVVVRGKPKEGWEEINE